MENWREIVQRLARQRAEQEVVQYWAEVGGVPVIFNYRWEHVRAVVRTAVRLAGALGADVEVVEAAAWLHDIRKGEPGHGRLAAEELPAILATTDFPAEKIDAVADAVRKHAGLIKAERVEPLEAAVLWDADKLSKVGLEGMLQGLAGLPPFSADEAGFLARERGRLQDLLPRIVASLNTALARRMGEQRLRNLAFLLDQLQQEYDVVLPAAAKMRAEPSS